MKYSLSYIICFFAFFAFLSFVSCDNVPRGDTVGPDIPSMDSLQVYLDKANKGDVEAEFIAGVLLQSKQSKQDSIKAFEYLNHLLNQVIHQQKEPLLMNCLTLHQASTMQKKALKCFQNQLNTVI